MYTSTLISDVTAVYHRTIMITMFGDYLIFQHNIACTFLRRWGQIITFDSTKEQLDSNFDCTLSLALFCRSLFLGWGGRQLCIQPLTKPPDSWLQRLGRFNRQVACIYWGLRPLSVCQLTGALGEKKIYSPSFVGYQLEGAKTIGWKPLSDWLYFWCLCSLPLHSVYLFVSVLQTHSHCFP